MSHHEPPEQLHVSSYATNQFLLVSESKRKSLSSQSSKDQVIRQLEQKNYRLNAEISKIEKFMNEPETKIQYGIFLPEVNKKLAQQELENAYKQIKNYESQIKRIRAASDNGSFTQQVKKLEAVLKQKTEMSQKLRKHLGSLKKQSMGMTKYLINDNIKEQYRVKAAKMAQQVKFYSEKLREQERKLQVANNNKQRQLVFIKKLQRELIEDGFGFQRIQQIRQKFMQKPTLQGHDRRGSTIYYEQREKSSKKDEVEDLTPQAYSIVRNQIKLLQKMSKDHQSQIDTLEKQRQSASELNQQSRSRLLQIQSQIQKIQEMIAQNKKMVDPLKVKPRQGFSVMNTSRYSTQVNRNSRSFTIRTSKKSFQHIYKHYEIGKQTRNGIVFDDRPRLGKNESKIVGAELYENRQQSSCIVGIQAYYLINGKVKKADVAINFDIKKAAKVEIVLQEIDEYIKSVECIVNEKGTIVGLSFRTSRGATHKAGCALGVRRPLNLAPNEYPVCFYGSLCSGGLQLFGVEAAEEPK